MAKSLNKLWSRSDPAKRGAGQNALLQAVRLQDNPGMGDVIVAASIDDLEWFLLMLDIQLEETPHWVKDPDRLAKLQAWTRHVRTMTIDILYNKRVAERPRQWLLNHANEALAGAIGLAIGVLLTWLLT